MSRDRISVLVTGTGGCGVGEGIAKAVLRCPDRYRLVAANMHADAPWLFRADAAWRIPAAGNPDYLDAVRRLCEREEIRVLIPGSEPELRVLTAAADTVQAWGVTLIANPAPVVTIGDDKWQTFRFLSDYGFGTPFSEIAPVSADFFAAVSPPWIIKPRSGHASQNVFLVTSREEAKLLLRWFEIKGIDPIVQEYAGSRDQEYTVSVLIGVAGDLLGSIAMRRRLLGGFSQKVEVESFDEIRHEAEKIAVALGARGPVNLQCRWTESGLKTFEINPRFSGTTPFRALVGFNEVDILIQNFLYGTIPTSIPVQTGVMGSRALEEMIVEKGRYHAVSYQPETTIPEPFYGIFAGSVLLPGSIHRQDRIVTITEVHSTN